MKLQAGEHYLTVSGQIIRIRATLGSQEPFQPFICDNGFPYTEDGKCIISTNRISKLDIVAQIPKELHQSIVNDIKQFHTDKDYRETIISVYGDK